MVIDMVIDETRLFTTKTKTNFTITFQLVKPEEYIMRKCSSLEDRFEKKIKAKCHKIMSLESKGLARKREQKKQDSIKAKFRGNLIRHRDINRISHHPHQFVKSDDSMDYNHPRKARSLVMEDSQENDLQTSLGDDIKEPLINAQGEEVSGENDNDPENNVINKMNVGEIMRYTARRKMSYDETIFKSVNKVQFQNNLNPDLDKSSSFL